MTIFASVLLGALFCCASGLIGYGTGAKQNDAVGSGIVMGVILVIVTLCFIGTITS